MRETDGIGREVSELIEPGVGARQPREERGAAWAEDDACSAGAEGFDLRDGDREVKDGDGDGVAVIECAERGGVPEFFAAAPGDASHT